VLLHAFPLNSQMWLPQTGALGDRYGFVCPDVMGFGASDAPVNPALYSMDAFADQVMAVVDHLGAEAVVLCGLSMGGYIAFAFLRRHPGFIAGLILADTKAEPDDDATKERRRDQQTRVARDGIAGVADELISGPLLAETTRRRNPEVMKRVRDLANNPPQGYIGALEAMKNRPDSTPELGAIAVPTLVVVGEGDAVAPPAAARDMHRRIAGSRLVALPEAGHLSSLEAPEAFNAAIAGFLSEL
jgi:3-oxoadipate enol-lactonase